MNMHESRVRSSNFEDNDYEDHDDDARDAREVKQVTREEDEGYNTRDYSPFQIMLMMMRRENKYSQSDIKTTGICRGSRMSSESQTEWLFFFFLPLDSSRDSKAHSKTRNDSNRKDNMMNISNCESVSVSSNKRLHLHQNTFFENSLHAILIFGHKKERREHTRRRESKNNSERTCIDSFLDSSIVGNRPRLGYISCRSHTASLTDTSILVSKAC